MAVGERAAEQGGGGHNGQAGGAGHGEGENRIKSSMKKTVSASVTSTGAVSQETPVPSKSDFWDQQ